jgi:hypothetical protein
MGVVVAQSQAAAAQARLAPMVMAGTANTSGSATLASRLPALAGLLGATASQQTHGTAALGKLGASIRVQALNVNTAVIVATLPRLTAVVAAAASQQASAIAALGTIASEIEVQAINVNTARIVASLPRLRGAGATEAVGAANAVGRLPLASHGTQAASQAAHAEAALPSLWTSFSLTAEAAGTLQATLGALASVASVQPPPAGYPVNDNYSIALPARPFVATLPARDFYVALPARDFYVLDKP